MKFIEKRNTKLNAMLADMDERILPNGNIKQFTISFFNGNGEFVYILRAKACGVKQYMKKGNYKGVVAIDSKGNEIGHPYPVYIHFIKSYKSNTFSYENNI